MILADLFRKGTKVTLPPSRPQPMVDRCVCHEVTFADIQDWARHREETTLDDIRDHWECGRSCGMCRPYLRRMLQTGDVQIPLMIPSN